MTGVQTCALPISGSAFADSYGHAIQADRNQREHLAKAQFLLSDAKRKERMGFTKEAEALTAAYVKQVQDANKNEMLKNRYVADASVNLVKAGKTGAGGAKGPKPFDIVYQAELAAKKDPSEENIKNLEAARNAAGALYSGTAGAQVGAQTAADKALASARYTKAFKDWSKNFENMTEAEETFKAKHKAGTLPKIFYETPTSSAPQKATPEPKNKVIKLD